MSYNWAGDTNTTVTVTYGHDGETSLSTNTTAGTTASCIDENDATYFGHTARYTAGGDGWWTVAWAKVNLTFAASHNITEVKAVLRGDGSGITGSRCFLVQEYSGGWIPLSLTNKTDTFSINGEAFAQGSSFTKDYASLTTTGVTQVEMYISSDSQDPPSICYLYELYAYGEDASYIKKFNNVVRASISKINGVALASVKKVMGVA